MFIPNVVGIAAAAALAVLPVSALACAGLVDGPKGRVVSVTDGDTLLLDNGLVVRLTGIEAPKLPRGNDAFTPWPLADTARDALANLVLDREVRLRHGGERRDRHGRSLGQLFVAEAPEIWVQQQLVGLGLARVYSFADNRACVGELLASEAVARVNRLGIWAEPYYAVRRAERVADLIGRAGHYELVEGRVLAAEAVGSRVYLNFGRVWKQDFTVVMDRAALRLFAGSGLEPEGLDGALIRVRGWVDVQDGPRIEVTHPEQIEVLASR